MSYVTLHPHSLSNPSGEFRVVKISDWLDWNPEGAKAIPCEWEFKTFVEAERKKEELNQSAGEDEG